VITSGGLIGVIDSVSDTEIRVDLGDRVRVRVAREDVDLYSTSAPNQ
jgi:preprotein translocase subunit YajC